MTTTPHALPDDLLAPDVNDDPYPFFRALREQDPVHWSERHRAWLLTSYDDCSAALMNFKALSSDRVRPLLDVMSEEQRAAAGPVYEMITGLDGRDRSARAPRVCASSPSGAFNPRRVAAMADKIQVLIDKTLDEFISEGHEDFIAHFSYPLPATVIAEIIGAPAEDAWRFRDWSQALAHVAFGSGGDDRNDRYVRVDGGPRSDVRVPRRPDGAAPTRARRGHDQRPAGRCRRRHAVRSRDQVHVRADAVRRPRDHHEHDRLRRDDAAPASGPDGAARLRPRRARGRSGRGGASLRGRDQGAAPLGQERPRAPRPRDQGRPAGLGPARRRPTATPSGSRIPTGSTSLARPIRTSRSERASTRASAPSSRASRCGSRWPAS